MLLKGSHLVVPKMRQRETTSRPPLQHVQRVLLAHGSPLPVGSRLCRFSQSQILFEFSCVYDFGARLRHSDAARHRVENMLVTAPYANKTLLL
jgi:hypothetical protein